MPQFVITGPDGKKYKVTGPTAEGALAALKTQLGSGASPNVAPSEAPASGAAPDIGASIPDVAVDRAQREYNALPWWGKPLVAANDLAGLAANGLTFGYGDKALAKVDEVLGRGTYDERLKKRRQETDDSRSRAGVAGAVAEIGGSVVPAVKVAQLGLTATRLPYVGRLLGMGIDGAGFGALTAAGNDQDIGQNAAIGALLGSGGQAVGTLLGGALKPIMARINPGNATREVMVKAMNEAGTNPQALAQDLANAQASGQGEFAVMDALGYPGQRLASTIARTPSDGRTPMVEFLEKRQAGQGRRVAGFLGDAFAPDTALQKVKALTESRKAGGDVNYTAARDAATNVDVSPVLAKIDAMTGRPFAGVSSGIDPDTVGGVLNRVRGMLAGPRGNQRMDFNGLLSVRSDLSDMANKAFNSGARKQGAAIKGVISDLDAVLADASSGYRQALEQYAKDSRVIDAVDIGKSSAMRGRVEDTIPAFNALEPDAQAAFRVGYVDPLIEQVQGAAVGVNKVRPLMNDAFEQEFPAFAIPGQAPLLGQRIAREKTMFDTMTEALRGSKTANNLADEGDLSAIDPSILGNLFFGNITGAAKSAVLQGLSALRGQPPAVRKMLSEALRVTNPQQAMQNLNQAVAQINASRQQKQAIVRALMLLGTAGASETQR